MLEITDIDDMDVRALLTRQVTTGTLERPR